jgi:putative acetyltransferase
MMGAHRQPGGLSMRPYDRLDLKRVATVFTESVHHLTGSRYTAQQRAVWAPIPPDLKYWRSRMRALQTLIAEVDAQCAGFISYQPNGYVELMYVSPEFERTGVATHLYRSVEERFIRGGIAEVYTEASLIAEPFFKAQGFHATRFEEIRVREVPLQRWVMIKKLSHGNDSISPKST